MSFIPISLNNYVEKHIKINEGENKNKFLERLKKAVKDKKNGRKCDCGNSIWAIGSAVSHYACFTCITGESYPEDDYEIEEVLNI